MNVAKPDANTTRSARKVPRCNWALYMVPDSVITELSMLRCQDTKVKEATDDNGTISFLIYYLPRRVNVTAEPLASTKRAAWEANGIDYRRGQNLSKRCQNGRNPPFLSFATSPNRNPLSPSPYALRITRSQEYQ
ncbi:uncharacterized protein ColSpa_09173 [Colletotrichum spaethianum]|uniref:Uncharacterized protein n=1 Tax=Colletotrichum spaethianum TaxID=700344 RepID=A0AA37UQL9_9PEZI|nr:uncharacterized protein ColSpa_09173 [Colletotrichum spaethianum]GKT48992.1 hypothetical protein ColSpa_09173 [Colletotrichum spaethianum]